MENKMQRTWREKYLNVERKKLENKGDLKSKERNKNKLEINEEN
jgi:hypothetical protein